MCAYDEHDGRGSVAVVLGNVTGSGVRGQWAQKQRQRRKVLKTSLWTKSPLPKYKHYYYYYYMNNHFLSYMELKETFSLPQAHLFCYLQVRHFVKNNLKHFEKPPKEYILILHILYYSKEKII